MCVNRIWANILDGGWYIKGAILYIGCYLSPALVSVGYILELKMSFLIFLGGLINWCLVIPIYSAIWQREIVDYDQSPQSNALHLWGTETRFIGVGAMLIGGVAVLVLLIRPLLRGIKSSLEASRLIKRYGYSSISRTERDFPLPFIGLFVACSGIVLIVIYGVSTKNVGATFVMIFFTLIAGFFFASIGKKTKKFIKLEVNNFKQQKNRSLYGRCSWIIE